MSIFATTANTMQERLDLKTLLNFPHKTEKPFFTNPPKKPDGAVRRRHHQPRVFQLRPIRCAFLRLRPMRAAHWLLRPTGPLAAAVYQWAGEIGGDLDSLI